MRDVLWPLLGISSCAVLEERSCREGEAVFEEGQLVGYGFRLPAGAGIHAPFDGALLRPSVASRSGLLVRAVSFESAEGATAAEKTHFTMYGAIAPPRPGAYRRREKIAAVGQPAEALLYGKFTLILSVGRYDQHKRYVVSDTKRMEALFGPR